MFLSFQPQGPNGRKRWRAWLRRLFAALVAPLSAFTLPQVRTGFKPELEDLENRLVPVGSVTAILGPDQVLRIQGTDQADTILVELQDNYLSIPEVPIQSNNQQPDAVVATQVKKIVITSGAGNDYVYLEPEITIPTEFFAGSGNATFFGGGGDDTLHGGSGMDYLDGGNGNNRLYAGPGNTTLLGGDGNDTLWGGTGNNFLQSGGGANVLHAGTGNDILIGGPGSDTLYGGPGRDQLFGGSGSELLLAGSGDNQLIAGNGNDTLYAGPGHDTLWAGAGTDLLYGGPGNTLMISDSGTATLTGGPGNDTLFGGTGNDVLIAGKGNDFLEAGSGNELLQGGPGSCTLIGGAGNDTLVAGTGNTKLYGGSGTTLFIGGPGNNLLYGGTGVNIFRPGTGPTTFYDSFDLAHPVHGTAQATDVHSGKAKGTAALIQAMAWGPAHGIDWSRRIRRLDSTHYSVKLYINGRPVWVKVFFNGVWTSNDAQPLDATGLNTGVFWPILVQRAYLQSFKINWLTPASTWGSAGGWTLLSVARHRLYG